jgi:hypothetical protein
MNFKKSTKGAISVGVLLGILTVLSLLVSGDYDNAFEKAKELEEVQKHRPEVQEPPQPLDNSSHEDVIKVLAESQYYR